jgi:exodeoxyribonuclease V alpha subunit
MKPETQWLKDKWAMPGAAAVAVEALFEAHKDGSTACKLDTAPSDWGRAVAKQDGDKFTPLVAVEMDGSTFLQTRWFFEAEKKIAFRLLALNSKACTTFPSQKLVDYFSEEGPQREAAKLALDRNLAIITGGPGTGKTYTLARIIALLLDAGEDLKRIQLTAPTGKAADRMKQAVEEACGALPKLQENLRAVASTSRTIHSLLGFHPGKNTCTYHGGHRLACKTLIVDECSMIDTLLWQALLEALPDDARLILLGDPNQLESVGRGNVFTEIARAGVLKPARAHLTKSHRFADRPAIFALAKAIEDKKADSASVLITENTDPACAHGLFWKDATAHSQVLKHLPPAVLEAMQAVAFAPTPEEALKALENVRILTSHRTPAAGQQSLGMEIEKFLLEKFPGKKILNRPVIIDRNDPETSLRNGEVGIVHTAGGNRAVHFDKRPPVSLSKLPEHSPAWSITIHRSQGSEYENVVVVLPKKADSPLATRQLLYTAITRAKKSLFLFGSTEVIEKAVAESATRITLLRWHLGEKSKPS